MVDSSLHPDREAHCEWNWSRTISLLAGLAVFGLAVPLSAGMPARGGAGHSLLNPPGSKAVPLPQVMSPLRVISADSLAAACVYPDMGAPVPDLAPDAPIPSDVPMLCEDIVGGVDHVVAGVGGRTKDSVFLSVAGVPAHSKVVEAYLYWAVLRERLATDGDSLVFEGANIEGELVGIAPQPCWDETTELVAFRAPVTDLIKNPINGNYQVAGLPRAEGVPVGVSPWAPEADFAPYFEGVGVVVVYLNQEIPWDSVVAIHDGAFDLFEELKVEHQLTEAFPIRPTLENDGQVRFSRLAADGQNSLDDEGTVTLNTWLGPQAEVLIRGSASEYDHTSDFTGAGGGTVTQLWDTETSLLPMEGELALLSGKTSYSARYDLDLEFLRPGCEVPPVGNPEGFGGDGPDPVEALVDCITVLAHVITVR